MATGWIDDFYNNSDVVWQIKSVDDRHNGHLTGGGDGIELDGGQYHNLKPHTHYSASWAGIPWYYQGKHYKAVKLTTSSKQVKFYTSEINGTNYIVYEEFDTGRNIARQSVPASGEFHCNMRFEKDGIYIDIVNTNDYQAVYEILNAAGEWVKVGLQILAQAVVAAAAA